MEKKATKQNKGEEHSKSIWGGHEGTGDLNKPIFDLDMGWEWAEEQEIPRTCSQFSSPLGGDYSNPHTERFEQATAGGGESGAALGPGSREERQEEAKQEKKPEKKMNPKSFPNTRGTLSEDEPEAVDMSIDSPDSPEEAGANARSPSPEPDYEPEEQADMLLDQAAIEVKMDSP